MNMRSFHSGILPNSRMNWISENRMFNDVFSRSELPSAMTSSSRCGWHNAMTKAASNNGQMRTSSVSFRLAGIAGSALGVRLRGSKIHQPEYAAGQARYQNAGAVHDGHGQASRNRDARDLER